MTDIEGGSSELGVGPIPAHVPAPGESERYDGLLLVSILLRVETREIRG